MRILAILALCALAYYVGGLISQAVDRQMREPLPEAITPAQIKAKDDIGRRFSLAGWCWSLSVPGRTVELYDPQIRGIRRVN